MLNLPQATRSEIAYLGGAYFAFFALVGLMVPYLSVYLDRLGYDSKSIGSVLAIVATMRIVAPSMWSAIADKTGYHLQIARLGALLALLSLLLLFWVETFVTVDDVFVWLLRAGEEEYLGTFTGFNCRFC